MLDAALENQHIESQTAWRWCYNCTDCFGEVSKGLSNYCNSGCWYFSVNDRSCFAKQTCSSKEATDWKHEKEGIFILSFAAEKRRNGCWKFLKRMRPQWNVLGFLIQLIQLQMKSRKLQNVYFFFGMGRLIATSRLIISNTSCFQNPLKRLHPS